MMKIMIKSSLEDIIENEKNDNNTNGLFNDGIISYMEDNINVLVNIVSENEVVIKRRCDEYELTLNYNKKDRTKGTYDITNVGNLELEIETGLLSINENSIVIEYSLGQNNQQYGEFKFCLEYEEYND